MVWVRQRRDPRTAALMVSTGIDIPLLLANALGVLDKFLGLAAGAPSAPPRAF